MKHIVIMASLLLLSACSSTPTSQSTPLNETDSMPDWVLIKPDNYGFAESSCVRWSGNISACKAQAAANARIAMAQQINLNVQALDKTYNSQNQDDDTVKTSSTFEQVSKQVTEQSLTAAIIKEVAFAKIDNKKHLCVLLTINDSKPLFDKLVKLSNVDLDPKSEAMLFQKFQNKSVTTELETDMSK